MILHLKVPKLVVDHKNIYSISMLDTSGSCTRTIQNVGKTSKMLPSEHKKWEWKEETVQYKIYITLEMIENSLTPIVILDWTIWSFLKINHIWVGKTPTC